MGGVAYLSLEDSEVRIHRHSRIKPHAHPRNHIMAVLNIMPCLPWNDSETWNNYLEERRQWQHWLFFSRSTGMNFGTPFNKVKLIPCLLSYQPASFFVLDEVDAALDNTSVAKVANYIRLHASDSFQLKRVTIRERTPWLAFIEIKPWIVPGAWRLM